MTRERKIPASAGYPLFGWTRDRVKAHLQEQPPSAGDVMIIYNAHGGFHSYSPGHGGQPGGRATEADRFVEGRQLGRHVIGAGSMQ